MKKMSHKIIYYFRGILLIFFICGIFISTSLLSTNIVKKIFKTISKAPLAVCSVIQKKNRIITPSPSDFSFEDLTSYITQISHGQAQLLQVFQGPNEWKGLVLEGVSNKHKKQIAWFIPSNMLLLFNGHLLSQNGKDLTNLALKKFLQQKEFKKRTPLFNGYLESFGQKKTNKLIYIFISADCPICGIFVKQIYLNYAQFFKKNKIAIEWIPLSNSKFSEQQGAKLLSYGFSPKGEYIHKKVDKQAILNVQQNNRLVSEIDFVKKTPTVRYEGKVYDNWEKLIETLSK